MRKGQSILLDMIEYQSMKSYEACTFTEIDEKYLNAHATLQWQSLELYTCSDLFKIFESIDSTNTQFKSFRMLCYNLIKSVILKEEYNLICLYKRMYFYEISFQFFVKKTK